MPVLPQYTAQPQPLASTGGRRATGADFYGGTDGLGKSINRAADQYITVLEENESRKALVGSSQVRAQYARKLDEAAQTGADLGELKQKMLDDLGKLGENFQTKKAQETLQLYTANTELMYDEQANRIEATRAAAEARLQGRQLLTSDAAIIQQNPAYLPEAEKNIDALVSTFGKLPPEKRREIAASLKQEQNMAAALASARVDPEGTKKKLEAGGWNLSPEHRNTAVNMADTQIRARRAEDAYLHAEKKRMIREADDKARDTHFGEIMGGTATRASIMNDGDLRPATREHLIALMEARAKELTSTEKRSDPATVRDLWLRIHADDSDPRKIFNGDAIFEAVKAGKVNTTDANNLNTLVANQRDENNRTIGQRIGGTVATVGRAISQDPQFTGQPALVASIQLDYAARVEEKVKEYRDAKKNPGDLFDQSNKDYVGSRSFIQTSIDNAKAKQRAELDAGLVRVNSQAEYDALAPGTPYLDSNGNRGVKKGAAKKQEAPKSYEPATPQFPIRTSGDRGAAS